MSDGGTGEKTEEASPQKLKQARDKGQVAKSQDAIQALSFVIVFSIVALTLPTTSIQLQEFLKGALDAAVRRGDDKSTVLVVLNEGLWMVILCSMPAAVSWIAYDAVAASMREVVLAARIDLWTGVYLGGQIIVDIAKRIGLLFVIVAAADFFWQRHVFNKDMMMSKYDVKQEYKQSEGDPNQKAERKSLAEELILHGSQQNVANADAVVVNPAHVAVAIKYDKEKGGAPRIVAKGMRKNAETIKEIARQAGVPILRNIPLAQALHKLDLEEEIPEELYEAVAEVLNFVFELKQQEQTKADARRSRGDPRLGGRPTGAPPRAGAAGATPGPKPR